MAHPRQILGTCPELLDVGHEPLVVTWHHSKPTIYSDGLRLRITVGESLIFDETLRVVSGAVHYQFAADGVKGEWNVSRTQAFQDCVTKAGKTLPQRKSVIFGPSHASIQEAVQETFSYAFDRTAILDAASVRIKNKKRISWGDQVEKVVEQPDEEHKYGGWGLETHMIIPNRFELREMSLSWSDLVMESEEMDEYFSMDDDDSELLVDRELRSYSLFDNDPVFATSSFEPRTVDEDEKTVYPCSAEPEEQEEEEVIEEAEEAGSDQSEDTTDEDEEGGALTSEASSRKRIKLEPSDETNEIHHKVETEHKQLAKASQSPPASCKPYEEELREYDFWLLQNEQPC